MWQCHSVHVVTYRNQKIVQKGEDSNPTDIILQHPDFTDKPVLTKYGHTAPGEGSGMDENPNTRSAAQPQGSQKTQAGGLQTSTVKTPVTEPKANDTKGKEEESGIENFQP
ncbi:uncharacterized protein F4822DRAFT_430154 [Hypoxylon trugodes]|uniref:uncharacterized protein n=1 Tax=Hypoxylon trugodes TaxID=326681 RepID=UPI00219A7664|nr:uncharacterized protein F4822DRAFT_430154 [Hypoxylon trugodes]KAI1387408.1 hypothetical protein F4822DRAFT_430154 [Hypoxylon trugodes]